MSKGLFPDWATGNFEVTTLSSTISKSWTNWKINNSSHIHNRRDVTKQAVRHKTGGTDHQLQVGFGVQNSSFSEGRSRKILSSMPTWITKWAKGQPGYLSETIALKKKERRKENMPKVLLKIKEVKHRENHYLPKYKHTDNYFWLTIYEATSTKARKPEPQLTNG